MSRRAPRIQLTITPSDRSTPAITNGKKIVTPSRAVVMPTVNSSGWMLGPGRWISSPARGISGSSGDITSGDVDGGGHERHAEHEEADGGDDEPRADVLACDVSIHGVSRILEMDVGDHRAEQQREVE